MTELLRNHDAPKSDESNAASRHYENYKAKCIELQRQLAIAKSKIPNDMHDATIEYLIEAAGAFIVTASTLVNIRLRGTVSPADPQLTTGSEL